MRHLQRAGTPVAGATDSAADHPAAAGEGTLMSEPDAYDAGFQARLGYIRVAPDGIVVDGGAIEHLTAGQVQMALSCFNSIHPCMTRRADAGSNRHAAEHGRRRRRKDAFDE